jgi:hypothetical protein
MTLWHFGTLLKFEYAVTQTLVAESAKVSKCHD